MRVVVGMSGGVDSSLATELLVEAGHEVIGVTMGLHPGHDEEAADCARRLCERFSIRYEFVERHEVFEREVVAMFAAEYADARTPNPCIVCNERIKFAALLSIADEIGADSVATGHYARIERDDAGVAWLARGADSAKDQSYFLYRLSSDTLARTLFPLGDMTKAQVRVEAAARGLESARRPDSQEVCFVADGRHAALVAERIPHATVPGDIVDSRGRVVGRHRGLAYYTVGQRKGLGIASTEPLYVVSLDSEANRVVVGPQASLSVNEIEADDVVWRAATGPVDVTVQTRYRMDPVPGVASLAGGRLIVRSSSPMSSVSPGQAVVCYSGDRVMGGGPVRCTR